MTTNFTRIDGRSADQLRPILLTPGWAKHAEGSCLVEWGDTKVLCTASIDTHVPPWLRGRGSGWLTAEYAMLPRSTGKRKERDGARGKVDGRGVEIQRLIGRSLRAVLDVEALGERTITIDCDVLQADGGTRCASISGAWVALHQALAKLRADKSLRANPLKDQVAAVSVGLVDDALLLDLPYVEDVRASLDMNVVMTTQGRLIEVQAGGEGQTFTREQLDALLQLSQGGIEEILRLQNAAIGGGR